MKSTLRLVIHNAALWWMFCAAIFREVEGAGNIATALVAINVIFASLALMSMFMLPRIAGEGGRDKLVTVSNEALKKVSNESLRIWLDVALLTFLVWHGWAFTASLMAVKSLATSLFHGLIKSIATGSDGGDNER